MLMVKTSKGVEFFCEIQFYNTFEHLRVKYVFGLKNHDFKSFPFLTKVIHFLIW
jgi:hypothetical protein